MPTNSERDDWRAALKARMAAHLVLKPIGITAFITLFFIGYLWILKSPVFPVHLIPVTALDRLVVFAPLSLWLYISLWVYVSLPPALMATKRGLLSFGLQAGILALVGLALFFFFPTTILRTDIDLVRYPTFRLLRALDAAGNACPSLHAAFAVFSSIWLHRLLQEIEAPRHLGFVNMCWCIGIVYSTLATKQHVAIDAIAGSALGAVAAWPCFKAAPQAVSASFKTARIADGS